MSKIDVNQWKEFNIGKLFDFYRGKEAAPNRVPDGNIPFISETRENNGMVKFASSEHIFPGKSITVSVNYASTVLYQEKDFCASVNIIVLHNDELTVNVGLFLAAVISKLHQKYSYNDKVSAFKLKQESIKLPVDSSDNPDWQYMDSYIAKRAALAHKYVSELAKAKDKPELLNVNGWKEFKLSSMFDICYGSFVPKKDRGTKTPFITTSSENNGISYYVDSNPMFRSDALTVASDGSVGETFYHDEPFSAGNIVVVLEPHDDVRAKWTPKSALFIATCIRKYAQIRHSWTDKYSVNRVRNTILPLPVDSTGYPDWHYMDNYVASMKSIASQLLNNFRQILS